MWTREDASIPAKTPSFPMSVGALQDTSWLQMATHAMVHLVCVYVCVSMTLMQSDVQCGQYALSNC